MPYQCQHFATFNPELDDLLLEPPQLLLRANDGKTIQEDLIWVAEIEAALQDREALEAYGVCMTYAHFTPKTRTWRGCLLSEAGLQMMLELIQADALPFQILPTLSQAEAEWRIARAAGATQRAPATRRQFVTGASLETLGKLSKSTGQT